MKDDNSTVDYFKDICDLLKEPTVFDSLFNRLYTVGQIRTSTNVIELFEACTDNEVGGLFAISIIFDYAFPEFQFHDDYFNEVAYKKLKYKNMSRDQLKDHVSMGLKVILINYYFDQNFEISN